MKFKLVQDDSGHDYVIPSDKASEWYLLDFEDRELFIPQWAYHVEGGLEFENPTENGKVMFGIKSSTEFLQEIESWLCFNKQPSRNEIIDLHNDLKKHLGLEI